MRGLVGVLSAYIIGVLIYFGALYVLKMKYDRVKQDLASISGSYTNALKDAAQIKILVDRQELKYKALDCLKAVAEHVPDNVTIDHIYFQRGKFELNGTASSDEDADTDPLGKFNEDLRHVNNPNRPDQPLFSDISAPRQRHKRGEHHLAFQLPAYGGGAVNNALEQLNLTPQERRIVVGIGMVLIVVLNLLFVWPHFSEWGKLQKQLATMRSDIERFNKQIALDTNPTNGLQKQLAKLVRQEGAGVADVQIQLQSTIIGQAHKAGVNVANYIPGSAGPQTNEFFERETARITFDSQEPQLINFLYNIGNDPAMIRVSELDLGPQDQNRYRLKGAVTFIANFAKRAPGAAKPGATKPAATKTTKPAPPGYTNKVGSEVKPATKPPPNKPGAVSPNHRGSGPPGLDPHTIFTPQKK